MNPKLMAFGEAEPVRNLTVRLEAVPDLMISSPNVAFPVKTDVPETDAVPVTDKLPVPTAPVVVMVPPMVTFPELSQLG